MIGGCGQDCVVILVLFSCSISSMCLFRGNSRTFRWSGMVLNVFCMVIIVLFSCSTSSMCLFRGNSRTFRWSGMVLNVFCMVIIVLFSCSTSSMCLFRGNSRTFRWSGMVLSVFLHGNHRAFSVVQLLQCAFFVAILVLFAGLGWS